MYTLRIVHQEKGPNGKFGESISNFELGNHYSVYGRNTKEFEEMFENATKEAKENARYIVAGDDGIRYIVSKETNPDDMMLYFIMSENGATFERLDNFK